MIRSVFSATLATLALAPIAGAQAAQTVDFFIAGTGVEEVVQGSPGALA